MRIYLIALLFLSWELLAAEKGLLHQWQFIPQKIKDGTVEPITGARAKFIGTANVFNEKGLGRLELKGKDTDSRAWVTDDYNTVKMPKETITVEAWISPAAAMTWGGIAGVIQDNGDYERGWLLGYVNRKFSFALASEGHKRLTYLQGTTDFKDNFWYHVVGTYDGNTLELYVNGKLEGSESAHSGPIIYPPKATFELGGYKDDNEFYRGAISLHEISIYNKVLNAEAVAKQFATRKKEFPLPPQPLRFTSAPQLHWENRSTLRIEWEMASAMPAKLEWKRADGSQEKSIKGSANREQNLLLQDLPPNREFLYRLVAQGEGRTEYASPWYEFDTSFYYRLPDRPKRPSPFNNDETMKLVESAAKQILTKSKATQGYALILGSAGGRLAYELARQTELKVIVVEPDAAKAKAARQALNLAGLYGVRASVHQCNIDDLPYGPYFANLIVSGSLLTEKNLPTKDATQLMYVLRPAGGMAILGHMKGQLNQKIIQDWFKQGGAKSTASSANGEVWACVKRGKLAGAGDWTHQYGSADNTTNSRDDLVRGEMGILWWGEPGPRPMPDRGGRNPAPLAANGRMFVQGDRVLFGLDAYNGTILWTFFSPEMRRSNLPRDGSNMVATDDSVFVAVGGECIALDAQTGKVRTVVHAPNKKDVGWLSANKEQLLTTSVKTDSGYKADAGEWYDNASADQVARLVSDSIVSHDSATGKKQWSYKNGSVMNSTITIAEDIIYFVESRNSQLAESANSRILPAKLTSQYLVALNRISGKKLWEKSVDFSKCKNMLYLIHADGTLIVTGSEDIQFKYNDKDISKKFYHIYAYDVSSPALRFGTENPMVPKLWQNDQTPEDYIESEQDRIKIDRNSHHGGHLQHPLVVGQILFSDSRAFNLRSKEVLPIKVPERRGCGNMAASNHSMFYRNHSQTIWDLDADTKTPLQGSRTGCWLGMIPAQGLMLVPESSGGCSCDKQDITIQTSAAWVPRSALKKPKK